MVRFNLLIIGEDLSIRRKAKRALGLFFRKNYLFSVANQLEAHKLLGKLHVDLVIVDLDEIMINPKDMKKLFPNVDILGVSRDESMMIKMAPQPIKVLKRKGVGNQLATIFKAMKKRRQGSEPQGSTINPDLLNFEDFSVLLPN